MPGKRSPPPAMATSMAPEPAIRTGAGITQYLQLASLLRHRIAHGELLPGTQLPTVADLAAHYQLARITVRQAYAVLSSEGLVQSQRGRGTFVTERPAGRGARLRSAINALGSDDLRFEILAQQRKVALPADLLGEDAAYADYAFIRKLHVQDGEPFCLAEIYVASEIHARFPPGSEQHNKIAWLINAHAANRMQRVRQTLTVAPSDLVLARQLQCSFSTPVAHMTRWIYDKQDRLALAGRFWYRGDRFVADVELPFDMWLRYPSMVVPDTRTATTASPVARPTGTPRAPRSKPVHAGATERVQRPAPRAQGTARTPRVSRT